MPMVPCPAITSGSSKGCTKVAGCRPWQACGVGLARRNRNRRHEHAPPRRRLGRAPRRSLMRRGHRHDDDRAQAQALRRQRHARRGCRLKPRSRRGDAAPRPCAPSCCGAAQLEGEHRWLSSRLSTPRWCAQTAAARVPVVLARHVVDARGEDASGEVVDGARRGLAFRLPAPAPCPPITAGTSPRKRSTAARSLGRWPRAGRRPARPTAVTSCPCSRWRSVPQRACVPRWRCRVRDGFESGQAIRCWLTVAGAGRRAVAAARCKRSAPLQATSCVLAQRLARLVILFEWRRQLRRSDPSALHVDRGTAPDHHAGASPSAALGAAVPRRRPQPDPAINPTSPTPTWCRARLLLQLTSGAGDDDPPRHQRHAGMRRERQHLRLVPRRASARGDRTAARPRFSCATTAPSARCSWAPRRFLLSAPTPRGDDLLAGASRPSPPIGLRFGGRRRLRARTAGTSPALHRRQHAHGGQRRRGANREFWNASYETACERDRCRERARSRPSSLGSVWFTSPALSWAGPGCCRTASLDAVATQRLMLTDPNDPAARDWRWRLTLAAAGRLAVLLRRRHHTLSVSNQNFAAGPLATPTATWSAASGTTDAAAVVVHNPVVPEPRGPSAGQRPSGRGAGV